MTEIFFSVENSYNVNFPEGGEGGGGVVLRISSDGDDRIRVKIKNPKKSLGLPAKPPQNSLEQN